MTYLYGFKLSHEDGSVSRWQFLNDNDVILSISIRLKNGAHHRFSEESEYIYNWARNRELKLEECVFQFDETKMTFVEIVKEKTKGD